MELTPMMQGGLELPKPVYEQAVLPPDITELSSEQLAEMFTVLTGWADYMSSQLVQAQLAERDALRKAEFAESKALVRLTTGAPKGTMFAVARSPAKSCFTSAARSVA